jgi:hypothetical protein
METVFSYCKAFETLKNYDNGNLRRLKKKDQCAGAIADGDGTERHCDTKSGDPQSDPP